MAKTQFLVGNIKGPPGKDGINGADGITPDISVQAEALPAGSIPTAVRSGPDSQPLITFGIPKGDPGGKGDKGDAGEKGEQGNPGQQGPKGDQGNPGQQGQQGLKGDQGNPGPKGDQGDTGPQGPQGPAGSGEATINGHPVAVAPNVSNPYETNLPIGTYILCLSYYGPPANSPLNIFTVFGEYREESSEYANGSIPLSGTWLSCGEVPGYSNCIMLARRIA